METSVILSNSTFNEAKENLMKSTKFLGDEILNLTLSGGEKKKICEEFDRIISNLTDFDIRVSKLRSDYLNYTKQYINVNLQTENPDNRERIKNEKEKSLFEYAEKMNELNGLLQQYKMELFQLKNMEKCPKKSKNLMNDVETSFLSLFDLMKDELKESKIEISFLNINIKEIK